MKKAIKIGLVGLIGLSIGTCVQKSKTENQDYFTFKKKGDWFLATPEGSKRINRYNEVGSVKDRMTGLLKEEYGDLKEGITKLKTEYLEN